MNIQILDSFIINQRGEVGNLYPALIIVAGTPIIRALQPHDNVEVEK